MAAPPSRLEARLLGPPEVLVDGAPLSVDTRKAIALLAYLVERDVAPTREELTWLLWPESPSDKARGNLRRTISALRSGLGGRWVEADRDRVTLDRTDLVHDTEQIEQHLDAVRGRFLEGFYLRDAAPFDDWQATTAEHYDRIVRSGLDGRARQRLSSGDLAGALADAERRLALDPLDESSHRLLMRALASSGDRSAAIRQYRSLVALLDDELAVEPLPETVELHESILTGALEPPPTPAPTPAPAPRAKPSLVPDDLIVGLRLATATPGAVSVVGPPGSGRSALVQAALPEAIHVTAVPTDGALAHGLTRTILEAVAAASTAELDERAAPAVHVAPSLGRRSPEPPALEGDLASGRLLDGLTHAIGLLVGERVLTIDDAHLADEASRSVVDRLVERSAGSGTRLVLTTETHGGEHVVETRPLDEDEVAALVRDSGHDESLAPTIIEATAGWMGPVIEALESDDPVAAVETQRRRRVAGLDPIGLQVLEALVALGSAGLDVVSEVAGKPAVDVAATLDRLLAQDLAGEVDGSYAPAAPWVSEVVGSLMGPARTALLHARAADAMTGDRDQALRARHLELAGRTEEAAVAHERAGTYAASVLAPDSSRDHFEAALALGHAQPGAIHLRLAEVETRAGAYPAALRALNAAAAEGTSWEIERSIGDVYARWGRWPLAKASFEAALSLAKDPAERATVLADLAVVAHRDGNLAEAEDRVAEALEAVNGEPAVAARVANVAGLVLDEPDHLLAAIAHARRARRREDEAAALNNLALAYARRDRVDESIALGDRALALLDRTGDRHRRAAIHGNLADFHHLAGDETASENHLRAAAGLFAEVGVGRWEPAIWQLTGW